MIKDIKYIIKRIIIGTGVAFAIMTLKGNFMLQAHALQAISSWSMGAQTSVVDNTTNAVTWTTGSTVFANQGDGELLFTFSIYKVSGSSTAPNVAPRFVRAHTSGDSYVCYIGSSTLENSTFNGGTYSAICPMHLESGGLTSVVVALQDNQQNDLSQYRVVFNGLFTWKRDTEYTLLDAINNKLNNIGNSDVINNQNNNTQNIINNQDSNTQDIINNQNSNTDKEIESQKVCKNIDFYNDSFPVGVNNAYLSSSGGIINESSPNINSFISDYMLLSKGSYIIEKNWQTSARSYCLYNSSKTLKNCYVMTDNTISLDISEDTYIRLTVLTKNDYGTRFTSLTGSICINGNQAIVNSQQDINNTLNDSNVNNATSDASSFFGNFSSNSHGLSGIITAPLRLINSLTTATCNPLEFNLPIVGNHVVLPCMRPIYENYFGVFFSLWQLITTGLISYNVCINLYGKVRNLQNPNNDRIEVLNL